MEVLFFILFVIWMIIPVFFRYNDAGAKSFIIVTIGMWVLGYFIPKFFLVTAWLGISTIIGVIVALMNFEGSAKKFFLWAIMSIISCIMYCYIA